MPKNADEVWQPALTMEAGDASTTLGDSTLATQESIDVRRATHVSIKISGLTLAGGISLLVFFLVGDDAETPVYGYLLDLGGSEFSIPIDGVIDGIGVLPAIPIDGRRLKLDVIVSGANPTAKVTLEVLRIYQT